LTRTTRSRTRSSTAESWAIKDWPENVFRGDPDAALYLVRENRDELVLAGALTRVGRQLVVLGLGYALTGSKSGKRRSWTATTCVGRRQPRTRSTRPQRLARDHPRAHSTCDPAYGSGGFLFPDVKRAGALATAPGPRDESPTKDPMDMKTTDSGADAPPKGATGCRDLTGDSPFRLGCPGVTQTASGPRSPQPPGAGRSRRWSAAGSWWSAAPACT
jgi:hypothetical protein